MPSPSRLNSDNDVVLVATVVTAATAVLWAPLALLFSPGWAAAGPIVFFATAGALLLVPRPVTIGHGTELAGLRCDPTGPIHAAMTALADARLPAHELRLHRSRITDGAVHHEYTISFGGLVGTVSVTPWGDDTAVGFAVRRTSSPMRRAREITASVAADATGQYDHEARTHEALADALTASVRHARDVALDACRARVPAVDLGPGRVVATASWDPGRLVIHPRTETGRRPAALTGDGPSAFDPYDAAEASLLND
jgi:hypothetical protein